MRGAPWGRRPVGFTLIEGLAVLMLMSIVVRLGIPSFQGMRSRAEAVRAADDLRRVREAVEAHRRESQEWPRDLGEGLIPPELAPHLPEGFGFRRGRYRLDLQNWTLSGGLPSRPGISAILALSVVTEDRELGAELEEVLGTELPHLVLGNAYTFILDTR